MKKSSFVAVVLGTVSVALFGLGMCMVLVQEWNAFQPGVGFGCAGLLLGCITCLVWRRMEHKPPVTITRKRIAALFTGVAGVLALGVGMCFSMIWAQPIPGVAIGMGGILILLCLIPLTKGIRD